MGHARVWVHRRHREFPDVGVGLLTLEEDTANALIGLGCAQPWHTDQRKLEPVDHAMPEPVEEEAAPEPSVADSDEAAQYVKPPKVRKKAVTRKKTPRYNRRDMRAED